MSAREFISELVAKGVDPIDAGDIISRAIAFGQRSKPSRAVEKSANGTRITDKWQMPPEWVEWARSRFPSVSYAAMSNQAERFRNYWMAKPGAAGVKLDWFATWRNWCKSSWPDKEVSEHVANEVAKSLEEAGKVRLHRDDPLFRMIGKMRGQMPPTDHAGNWYFTADEIRTARERMS
jgi:hypothetical protein